MKTPTCAVSVFLTVISWLLPAPGRAATLPVTDDAVNSAGLSGAGTTLALKPGQNVYLKFDPFILPANPSTVRSARLRVFVNKVTKPGTVQLVRIDGDWSETTLRKTTAPTLGAAIGSVRALVKEESKQFIVFDVTAEARDWVNGTANNYGLALTLPEDSTLAATLDSKETSTTGHEPALEVEFGHGVGNVESGNYSVVAGGQNNTASGSWSAVLGGAYNVASAITAIALGTDAHAQHSGTLVFGDGSGAGVYSSTYSQVTMRASNGYRFFTNAAMTTGVQLTPGSGGWANASDVNLKTAFAPVDAVEVVEKLAQIPIGTWQYKSQDAAIRHLGPTAQDFHAAFGLGESDKLINTLDEQGVALAAIQGVYRVVEAKEKRIGALEAEKAEQAARLRKLQEQNAVLEDRLKKLEARFETIRN